STRRSLPATLARTQITGSGLILARRGLTNTPLERGRLLRGPAAAIAMARQLGGQVLSRAYGTGLPRSLGPLRLGGAWKRIRWACRLRGLAAWTARRCRAGWPGCRARGWWSSW